MNNEQLVNYLKRCDEAYFKKEKTLVSDATYDALVETLRRIDPKNEYLQTLGSVKVETNKIGRLVPMGTLSKVHTDEEVMKWLSNESGNIMIAPKYDGFAVELVYKDYKLVSASTRGDFYVGEDVLEAITHIQSIPTVLCEYAPIPGDFIVRGEAIIPIIHHDDVKSLGYTAMRNAVPGIVRSCREEALKFVDFIAYEFIDGINDRVYQRNSYESIFKLEDYSVYSVDDFSSIKACRDEFRAREYDYEIDGVVLKSINIRADEDYASPKYSIAWKYQSKLRETTLRDVEFSMGVTGYFTPIGVFDEVEFQGAKLTRASLGNITRLVNEFEGLTIGSLVEVSRRGDIIPYIESAALIDNSGMKVEIPTVCPHCGQPLEYKDKEPHCVNKSCPEKLRLQIVQYARAIGVKGIGDRLVSGLIEAGHLKRIPDIYSIDPEVIYEIPRQGESAVNKWKTLQEKRLTPVEFLSSYPFDNLGNKIWNTVLSEFSLDDIINIESEKLVSANLRGIGESKIDSIVSQVKENREELESLISILF